MDLFIMWFEIIFVTILGNMIPFIMNIKIFEFGSGETYLAIRVSAFVYTSFVTSVLLFILWAYFKRGK